MSDCRLQGRPHSVDRMTAFAYFSAKLRFETDVSDVHTALEAGPSFVLVDSRGDEAWGQGRIAGALHLPTREIARRAAVLIPQGTPIVTYCWGPACNGATRAALEFARLGYPVREMIGGFEYWVREGLAVETDEGMRPGRPDPLTTVVAAVRCDC
jgi:rhodanese-related sulfurtransferase